MTPLLVGRHVHHEAAAVAAEANKEPERFLVQDIVFDQKTGFWLLLVSSVDDGRIEVWKATEAVLQLRRTNPRGSPITEGS